MIPHVTQSRESVTQEHTEDIGGKLQAETPMPEAVKDYNNNTNQQTPVVTLAELRRSQRLMAFGMKRYGVPSIRDRVELARSTMKNLVRKRREQSSTVRVTKVKSNLIELSSRCWSHINMRIETRNGYEVRKGTWVEYMTTVQSYGSY
jgi:hypothetical protein